MSHRYPTRSSVRAKAGAAREKEAAEALVQLSNQKDDKGEPIEEKFDHDPIEVLGHCEICRRHNWLSPYDTCLDGQCPPIYTCSWGCQFNCFYCNMIWYGCPTDNNQWFWAGRSSDYVTICDGCAFTHTEYSISRTARGLFTWYGPK